MEIEYQVYSYKITKDGLISVGENYLSKLNVPVQISNILKLGAKNLVVELDNEKYVISKSDSVLPGIPFFNTN